MYIDSCVLALFNKWPGNIFRFGLNLPKRIVCQFSQLLLILCGYHFKSHDYILKLENKKYYSVRRNVKMWQIQLYIEYKHMRKAYFHFLFLCRNRELKNDIKYSSDLSNPGSRKDQKHAGEAVRWKHNLKSNRSRKYHMKQVNHSA